MKIAVSSQNFRTITSHAGKTRRFLIYRAEAGGPVEEIERLDLPKDRTIHEFHDSGPGDHPLYAVDVIITGSAGDGFIRRMEAHGVKVAPTSEDDPLVAIAGYLAGALPPAVPHAHGGDGGGS
ncbi:MAG: hypothetical protein VR70_07450 [Rhodospirillaceae bacterium BRH_c57]|nr:MAG: hypothetical protein VR70_07450 [Rhodospirillaceae bacterium BRH_c57]